MNFETFRNAYDSGELVTSAYVFSADELEDRLAFIRSKLDPSYRLVYAIKANPFLVELLDKKVDGFEICSPGELKICESCSVDVSDFVISGVNKERKDMERFAACGNEATFTIESVSQAQLLQSLAEEKNTRLSVLIRLTSGNQFGVDEDTLFGMIKTKEECIPDLDIRGIQYFSGTQKKDKKIKSETEYLDTIITRLYDELGFETRELEFGPGLYVPYFVNEADTESDSLENLNVALKNMNFKGRITLEMGRFIAAPCGYFVTKICDAKNTRGAKYLIVDGGIHQLNYYGQMMAMKIPYIMTKSEGEEEHVCICGSLCTVGDVLARDVVLKDPQIGDLLVFAKTGAYSVTEGISHFLSRDLPSVYIYKNGKICNIRERQELWEDNYGHLT